MQKLTFERFQDPNKITGRLVDGLQIFYDIRCGRGNRLVDEDELADWVDNNGPIIVAYDHAGTVLSFGQFFQARLDLEGTMHSALKGSNVTFRVETLSPLWAGKLSPDACRELSVTIESWVVGLAMFTARQHGWEIVSLEASLTQ